MLLLSLQKKPISYHETLRQESIESNKNRLMCHELLLKSGVSKIFVDYDGSNDSGWIDEIRFIRVDHWYRIAETLKNLFSNHDVLTLDLLRGSGVFWMVEFQNENWQDVINDIKANSDRRDFEKYLKYEMNHFFHDEYFQDSLDALNQFGIHIPECFNEDAIKNIFYDVLESRHGGWEINDGSFGTFEWDIVENSIEHEHSTRYYEHYTERKSGWLS